MKRAGTDIAYINGEKKMKKIFLLIGLVLLAVSGVFAQVSVAGQTFYFKYVNTVDSETGVRSFSSNIKDIYITFTGNSCYTSDEKGIKKKYFDYPFDSHVNEYYEANNAYVYLYQGEQNNLFVFTWKSSYKYSNCYEEQLTTLYFSKDYKRMNVRIYYTTDYAGDWFITKKAFDEKKRDNNNVFVFERADPPQKVDPSKGPEAPKQLW